ncbi:MAG: carbohydrate-binding family 9-like protein [Victivallaceae bacterium]
MIKINDKIDRSKKSQNFFKINYFKNFYLHSIFWATIVFMNMNSLSAGEVKPYIKKSPVYKCYKIPEGTVHIDGKLDEECWKNKPVIEFRQIENGTLPKYQSAARIVWDDKYLYIGMELEDPNVWGRWGVKDKEIKKQRRKFIIWDSSGLGSVEIKIMESDPFIKIFLDPDADRKRYLEFHINVLNNVFDCYLDKDWELVGAGDPKSKDRWKGWKLLQDSDNWHPEWNCAGLKSATQIYGTLNFPDDRDKGWSVEVSIPWKSLKDFTKNSCPPQIGDKWKGHLGRAYRTEYRGKKQYWTWPVIGAVNCHLLNRYGFLIFCGLQREGKQ